MATTSTQAASVKAPRRLWTSQSRNRGTKRFAMQALPFVVLVALWEFVAGRIADPQVLPSPGATLDALGKLLAEGTLPAAVSGSITTLLIGTAFCVLIAVPLGIAIALNQFAAGLVEPIIRFFSNVSGIALIPLFIMWFGFTNDAVYASMMYTVVLPIFFATLTGVQIIPTNYDNALRTLGANRLQTVRHVYLPGALPGIFVGVRLGLGYGWRAVVGAELIVGQGGLGKLLSHARAAGDTSQLLAAMVVIGVFFLIIDNLLVMPWSEFASRRWASS